MTSMPSRAAAGPAGCEEERLDSLLDFGTLVGAACSESSSFVIVVPVVPVGEVPLGAEPSDAWSVATTEARGLTERRATAGGGGGSGRASERTERDLTMLSPVVLSLVRMTALPTCGSSWSRAAETRYFTPTSSLVTAGAVVRLRPRPRYEPAWCGGAGGGQAGARSAAKNPGYRGFYPWAHQPSVWLLRAT